MSPDFFQELVRLAVYEGWTRAQIKAEFDKILAEGVDEAIAWSLVDAVFDTGSVAEG